MRIIISLAAIMMAVLPVWAQSNEPATYEEAADAIVAQWTEELGPAFRNAATLPEAEFIPAWEQEYQLWLGRLDAAQTDFAVDPALADRYEARILYEWAVGRLFYPVYHRDLTGNPGFQPSEGYDEWQSRVDFNDASLLDLEEYTFFLSRWRNLEADELFGDEATAISGSVKYLTAKLMVTNTIPEGAVRCWLDAEALGDWLEDHAADGLNGEVQAHAESCPGDRADALMATYTEEMDAREGHPIEIFKTVGDDSAEQSLDLELHIYPPEGWQEGDPLQPAVVWLHGGGWSFGSWSWCGACVYFKDRGMAVAQVEYRTHQRFGTHVRDGYEDAADAIAWLRENGAAYGVDPERVAVAGFSAGAHLSLALASLEEEGASRPDMALSISGCTDILRDPYSVRMAGGEVEARALSPLFQVNPASPPIYMANATEDTDCHFGSAKEFADKAERAGVDVAFTGHPEAGHFFLRDPALSRQTREEVDAFLSARGF